MSAETLAIHTERWHESGDRYRYDFERCRYTEGWAQMDTGQDASYFGQWANPLQLRVMTYCEGDCSLATASSVAEFVAEIRRIAGWNKDNGHSFAIDGMCRPEIIEAFEAMGLGDLLH